MPLSLVYCVFVALWGGYLLLAIYIDNILPNEYGVSRCAWFGLGARVCVRGYEGAGVHAWDRKAFCVWLHEGEKGG